MSSKIFCLELDGKPVLGFNTGLGAQAFAQAKMAHFITSPGIIALPGGSTELWRPEGVLEYVPPQNDSGPVMLVYGPEFRGELLSELVNDPARKDEALDAVRYWLGARTAVEESQGGSREGQYPGPAGALIITARAASSRPEAACQQAEKNYPEGTVFFPPGRLLKRTLEADGPEAILLAERWVHPGLEKSESTSFCASAMLYGIFCGAPPFARNDRDELIQDIREEVFIPPALAAPGLDPEMAELITRSMGRAQEKGEGGKRPTPDSISGTIGPPSSRPVSSWILPLNYEEQQKIRAEREQYGKKKALAVKTRRFVIRNTAIIGGAVAAVIIALLIARGQIRHKAELPTTKGMTPVEVAKAYYGAFGDLDHTLMDACVSGKAGKGDIETVINLFVINRVRMAYETAQSSLLPASEWMDAGQPDTDRTVFGVTDLATGNLRIDDAGGKASLTAEYTLWMPGSFLREDEYPEEGTAGIAIRDNISFVFLKDCWRISEIDRDKI